MNKRSTGMVVAAAFVMATAAVWAAGEGWTDNFEQARKQAAAEGKDILMDFTGSDWCGWCIRLDNEVFQQEAFKASAPKDFVLVVLDYPRDKSRVSEETAKQNERLKKEFAIRGYPTLFLTDAAGRPYAIARYQAGGPEKYLEYLADLKAVGAERNKALAAAEAATDNLEKAKYLSAALDAVGPDLARQFYAEEIGQIVSLDADNVAGLKVKFQQMGLDSKMDGLLKQGKFDEAASVVDACLAEWNLPEGDAAALKEKYEQTIFDGRFRSLMQDKKYEELIAFLESKIKADKPEGRKLIDLQLIIARTYAIMKQTEKSLNLVDDIISEHNLKGPALQDALLVKYNAYWYSLDKPNQLRIMEEIVAADPDSEKSKAIQKGLDAEKAKAAEEAGAAEEAKAAEIGK